MKILCLSPYFFPLNNGLADYSTRFVRHLQEEGHEVDIVCQQGLGEGFPVFFQAAQWNLSSFFRLFLKMLSHRKKQREVWDKIIIQFVPHMYSQKGGLVPSLGLFSLFTRIFFGDRVQVMFHELHYPFAFKAKDLLMWACHHFMFILCLWSAKEAFFSTHTNLKKGELLSLGSNCFWLPVGSNISRYSDVLSQPDPSSLDSPHKTNELHLAMVGGFHVSKRFDLVFDSLWSFLEGLSPKKRDHVILHFIGALQDDLPEALRRHPLVEKIKFHGKLEDHKVSEVLWWSDFLITYFNDGLSTRRGSALAGLNQGIEIISTKDWGTDSLFEDFPNISLFDSGPEKYKNQLISRLSHELELKSNPEKSTKRSINLELFDRHFGWRQIIHRYSSLSS